MNPKWFQVATVLISHLQFGRNKTEREGLGELKLSIRLGLPDLKGA